VFVKIEDNAPLYVYGSVFTIKDRWAAWSDKTYTDRVNEQCAIIGEQARARMIVCGDFNFRGRGHYNKRGRLKLERIVEATSLVWPTRQETRTVQHLLHAPDLQTVGYEVLKTTLSDHPVLTFELD
jgi:endonuclease/exonuclease/phosphatase family metal-dependent hydrolase